MARLSIIGIGAMGRHHARAARALRHDVAAACASQLDSDNWGAFAQIAPDAVKFDDWRRALAEVGADAAVICLPWDKIDPILVDLVSHPLPMLIEKPAALSADRLRVALAAERSAGKAPAQIGYNRRFYPAVIQLRNRLAAGGLRAARIVIAEDVRRLVERLGEAVRPHVLAFSSAAHSLDLMLHLLPDLEVRDVVGDVAVRGGLCATCLGRDGVPVALTIAIDATDRSGQTYYFDDGTSWVLQPLEHLERYDGYDVAPAPNGGAVRVFTPRATTIASEIARTGELPGSDSDGIKPGIREQLDCFVRHCIEGGIGALRSPAATLEDALRLAEFTEAICNANDNHRH